MFFNLSKKLDKNFPNHYVLPNNLVLSTDDGWNTKTIEKYTFVYKGYVNHCRLEDCLGDLQEQSFPTFKGNFCAFIADSNSVRLIHDTNRGFPLWVSSDYLTNLHESEEQIWADCIVEVQSDLTVNKQWYKPFTYPNNTLTNEQVIETLHNKLCTTVEQFLTHNTLPLKVFLTGGIDTTTLWAYIDHFTKNYELLDYIYIKLTPFYKSNVMRLKQFWAYNQIHLWDADCVLVTGGNGDENMLRGPTALAMILKHWGLTLDDILTPDDYHYTYFKKKKIDIPSSINDDVFHSVLDMNINDHQHWHLDRTLTFTPFKDITLSETILSASKDLIIKQAKSAHINKELIRKLDSKKLDKISNQKNYKNFKIL